MRLKMAIVLYAGVILTAQQQQMVMKSGT